MKGFAGTHVAAPVLPYLHATYPNDGDSAGLVRGSGSMAAYIDIDGFVIAITGRTVPAMPNGIGVMQQHGLQAFRTGTPVTVRRNEVRSEAATVSLRRLRRWDPRVPQDEDASEGLLGTGREIWWRLRLARTDDPREMVERLLRAGYEVATDADGRAGLEALFGSLVNRDPRLARRAADLLVGRGPGLTPEGDDVLAAVAATVYACERSIDWTTDDLTAWRRALVPDDLRHRTTALSATLLELAAGGYASEPVQVLLDVGAPAEIWLRELKRLKKIGHGTGRAWAAGCAATAILLTR